MAYSFNDEIYDELEPKGSRQPQEDRLPAFQWGVVLDITLRITTLLTLAVVELLYQLSC